MTRLEDLKSTWAGEVARGAESDLRKSPAFQEAILRSWAPGWYKEGPEFLEERMVGTKAAGIRYEKKVCAWLEEWAGRAGLEFKNHWWLYTLKSRWFQPDFVTESADQITVFECKLTYVDSGWHQLNKYARALGDLFKVPVRRVLVCKNVIPGVQNVVYSVDDIHDNSLWHYPL